MTGRDRPRFICGRVAGQVVREVKELGLVGVSVGTHVPRENGAARWDLGDVVLAPFFEARSSDATYLPHSSSQSDASVPP